MELTPNGLVKLKMPPVFEPVASGVHRTVGFYFSSPFFHIANKKRHPDGWRFLFGDPERTRTVDLQRDRLAC